MAKKLSLKKGKKQSTKEKTNIFSGVQEELRHVEWPTRKEASELTITVVVISLIVAVFVGIIDFSLAKILELLTQNI